MFRPLGALCRFFSYKQGEGGCCSEQKRGDDKRDVSVCELEEVEVEEKDEEEEGGVIDR